MRKTLFTRFKIISLSVTFFSFFIYPNPDNFKSVNEKLDQFLSDTEYNGAILIAKNGKAVFKKAYGFGDIDHKVKLTPKSSFNLASLSKQFTATGIMVLFEKNKLKLDDPVAKYLPQFSYVKEITIRHLLHHTSGLPCIYKILESQWDKSKIAGNEVMLEVFAKQKPKLLFKPGEKMQYSNTGYIVLASIIEKVSGQPFFEFMEKNIFKPLNMNDSYAYYKTMKEYPGRNGYGV